MDSKTISVRRIVASVYVHCTRSSMLLLAVPITVIVSCGQSSVTRTPYKTFPFSKPSPTLQAVFCACFRPLPALAL